jgi:hypothetical protein
MTEAEVAVRGIATALPADVRQRIITAAKLSAADRHTVVEKSRAALHPFLPTNERDTSQPAPEN